MNRQLKTYHGRNEESSVDNFLMFFLSNFQKNQQFNKEINKVLTKNTNLSSYLDRRRKVFDGSKEEKHRIK